MTHRKSVVFLEVGANKDGSKNRCWKSYIPSIQCNTKNYDDIVGGKFEKYFATMTILILAYKV
jgi:hypothetical protein